MIYEIAENSVKQSEVRDPDRTGLLTKVVEFLVPFDEDGNVNQELFEREIETLAKIGFEQFGEPLVLSEEDKKTLMAVVVSKIHQKSEQLKDNYLINLILPHVLKNKAVSNFLTQLTSIMV